MQGAVPGCPKEGLWQLLLMDIYRMQVSSTSHFVRELSTAPAALLAREPKKMWDELFLEGLPGFRVEVSGVGSLGWDVGRGRIPDGQFLWSAGI